MVTLILKRARFPLFNYYLYPITILVSCLFCSYQTFVRLHYGQHPRQNVGMRLAISFYQKFICSKLIKI